MVWEDVQQDKQKEVNLSQQNQIKVQLESAVADLVQPCSQLLYG